MSKGCFLLPDLTDREDRAQQVQKCLHQSELSFTADHNIQNPYTPLYPSKMPRPIIYTGTITAQVQQNILSEGLENFELPKSVVMKIAKSAVRGGLGQGGTTVEVNIFLS